MRARLPETFVLFLAAPVAAPAAAQCPTAADGFDLGGVAGTIGDADVFDLGDGPALYVIGEFSGASGGVLAENVARWRDGAWHELGKGLRQAPPLVRARARDMLLFDDGSGPMLYVGGEFAHAGDVDANGIAAWDGTRWHRVGTALQGRVTDLEVHDDGSGRTLWALSDVPYGSTWLWKLDAGDWTLVTTIVAGPSPGIGPIATCMASFDDGSGPAMFVGGSTFPGTWLRKWDGSTLADVAGFRGTATTMRVWDDGTGRALYVGGNGIEVGGTTYGAVARLHPTGTWSAVGSPLYVCWFLKPVDLGAGVRLTAAAQRSINFNDQDVFAWNGASWDVVPGAPPYAAGRVVSATGLDRGQGPELVLVGSLLLDGSRSIASWDGQTWRGFGTAQQGCGARPDALLTADLGAGPRLYAKTEWGGLVTGAYYETVGEWDGSAWSVLPPFTSFLSPLIAHDMGNGPTLLAAELTNLCELQSGTWTPRWILDGSGVEILDSISLDLGTGQQLLLAGSLQGIGDYPYGYDHVETRNVAGWSAATGWFALGDGLQNTVHALAAFDDGNGLALYAGGALAWSSATGTVARWNGSTWERVGAGTDGNVTALAVFDDGTGPALYVGGEFQTAGGVTSPCVARWDGQAWSALGAGIQSDGGTFSSGYRVITDMQVFDDGNGPALYVAGTFHHAGGVEASNVARWTGSAWEPLGSGATHLVLELEVFDDSLYLAGPFSAVDGVPSANIARWGDRCASEANVAFCEATDAACPCGNGGDGLGGCDTPQATGGVRLELASLVPGSGTSEVATLRGSGFPASSSPAVLLLRAGEWSRDPAPFGDGLACLGGLSAVADVRLAAAGSTTHVVTEQDGAGVRYYQLRYRSNPAAFCDATAAFNTSNAFKVTW